VVQWHISAISRHATRQQFWSLWIVTSTSELGPFIVAQMGCSCYAIQLVMLSNLMNSRQTSNLFLCRHLFNFWSIWCKRYQIVKKWLITYRMGFRVLKWYKLRVGIFLWSLNAYRDMGVWVGMGMLLFVAYSIIPAAGNCDSLEIQVHSSVLACTFVSDWWFDESTTLGRSRYSLSVHLHCFTASLVIGENAG
jgi:hypothetical protein